MLVNKFENKLKASANEWIIVSSGILLIVIYKFWKITIHKYSYLNSYGNDYQFNQICLSFYRIVASIAGVFLISKYFKNNSFEFQLGNMRILFLNIFVFIPCLWLSRYFLFGLSFSINNFIFEAIINFFVGSFEEIAFRGLILIGLSRLLSPLKSILLSSLIFALWHYDVVPNSWEYIFIFLWGTYAALCIYRGASLLSLILFHYLWDLVMFGCGFENVNNIPYPLINGVDAALNILFILILFHKSFAEKNRHVL